MYRLEWVNRGYPSTCASASAAPPPPNGFARVYHLCEATYAVANIEKSRLKIATFADANDPFELSVFYSRDAALRLRLKQFIDDVAKRFGIVCFSEDWLDPTLWSHYGDKHRGIALGFDISEHVLLPVQYQSQRIPFPVGPVSSHVDQFLGTKYASWAYERERRIMVELAKTERETVKIPTGAHRELFFEKFSNDVRLREVIVGPLCSENVAALRAKVNSLHNDVTTFKARLADKFFSVVPDEPTVPRRKTKMAGRGRRKAAKPPGARPAGTPDRRARSGGAKAARKSVAARRAVRTEHRTGSRQPKRTK
jgi:hypothetical protein